MDPPRQEPSPGRTPSRRAAAVLLAAGLLVGAIGAVTRAQPALPVLRPDDATPAARTGDDAAVPLPIRRAVIHHLGGTSVVAALRAAGQLSRLADSVELRVVDDVPEVPSIRYFFPEDAGAARVAAVALAGSGRFQIRGFLEYTPPPRPGLIEVWLPPS